jgi:hypothetical protein
VKQKNMTRLIMFGVVAMQAAKNITKPAQILSQMTTAAG